MFTIILLLISLPSYIIYSDSIALSSTLPSFQNATDNPSNSTSLFPLSNQSIQQYEINREFLSSIFDGLKGDTPNSNSQQTNQQNCCFPNQTPVVYVDPSQNQQTLPQSYQQHQSFQQTQNIQSLNSPQNDLNTFSIPNPVASATPIQSTETPSSSNSINPDGTASIQPEPPAVSGSRQDGNAYVQDANGNFVYVGNKGDRIVNNLMSAFLTITAIMMFAL